MANIRDSLQAVMNIDGVEATVLVDLNSGCPLGSAGGTQDTELEAAAHADLLKAKEKIIKTLGYRDGVEDMLITTWSSYVLLRRVVTEHSLGQNLMLFVKLRKGSGGMGINLAMTRFQLKRIEAELVV